MADDEHGLADLDAIAELQLDRLDGRSVDQDTAVGDQPHAAAGERLEPGVAGLDTDLAQTEIRILTAAEDDRLGRQGEQQRLAAIENLQREHSVGWRARRR
ncbi:MAG: hypothetical protein KDE27_02490, partial [Planctomycetes bacterium]|nr:hypothetical protein [Planctomycetota bacterium]